MANQPIYLKQLELGPMQNFVYLLGDPTTHEAAVVDPGWEVPAILRSAQEDGYRLTKVILTHSHFDHIMGLEALLQTHDIPVHIHAAEATALKIDPSSVKPVDAGQVIQVGALAVTLIHTPGHTPGSQCLLAGDRLLTGDTLFIRACGRCDLPGGDPRALYHSLTNTLSKLDDSTAVYPGHNYAEAPTSTVGQENQQNPFLRLPTVEDFLRLVGAR
ncbi:MAG TPA: MBL fold hydrolase [Candidatus Omnitrophica bacterium]|nr:MAG: hypothetical protein A3B73_01710 [Omnitrophica WOR_2 bacterium RIFCSPHIGHO2_02_FULL_63_39]OGX49645.1 MAG: hypothetical protein A3G88_02865 [Omnitrophica WOR_2 bacterium RIFCSPLOWO2_12_FULL_63_16]HBH96214.1 MBL fold hydrolase [Candidatus Omnitrophota bacterium]